MKNTFLSLSLIFTLVACGKGGNGGNNETSPVNSGDYVNMEEISTDLPVPTAALNFDVQLKLENFNAEQEDKILNAADMIKKIVASEEFKNRILKHKYNGKLGFVDSGGLTNAEIYQKIIEGSEKLNPGKNNTMDLDLETYHANNIVVGYTMPSVIRIWMNTKFLNQNSAAEVTTNMMHEWLHKIGFKHASNKTPTRKYSVPYAVGYLVRELARKMS